MQGELQLTLRIEYPGKQPVRCTISSLIEDGSSGRQWYRRSRASIRQYAREIGECPGYVADVIAILSPRVSVSHNIRIAREYLETGSIERGVMQARRLALDKYEEMGRLSGPKVQAFSRALRGDEDACVVDVWIFRAFGVTSFHLASYRKVESRVRRAAQRCGWSVSETQAAIWVGTKRVCGFNKTDPIDMWV